MSVAPTRLLLATRNHKKVAELRRILDEALGVGVATLVGLDEVEPFDEVPETGLTFRDNALLKARDGALHTGLPTIADDSGLAVDALNGMPGVFSARWAAHGGDSAARDKANLDLVLAQLHDVGDDQRGAAFVCAAALVTPDGGPDSEVVVEATMRGHLIRHPRGGNGFGYDPAFVADGESRTNAELTAAEKDAISHRGKAFRALAKRIAAMPR